MLFNKSLVNSFWGGVSLKNLTLDSAALFINSNNPNSATPILFSFKHEKDAYEFYLINRGINRDRFLFYPNTDLGEKVPGFNIESDRYRAETIIKLQKTQTTLMCIGTDESFKKNDIPVNTSESICSISITPEVKKDRDEIVESLVSWGYKKTDTVFGPMEFAVRGEIIDIFPNHFRQPIRIVFNYDIVEHIYIFDQSTQLTTKSLPKLNIKGRAVSAQTIDFISLTDYSRAGIIINSKYKDGLVDFFHNVPGEQISLDIFPIELKNISIKNRINKINDLIIKNSNVFIVGGEREKSILDEKFKDAIWLSGNIKTGFHSSFLNCFVISSSDVLNERKSFPKWEPPQAKRHENITRNDLSSLAYGDLVVHKTFGVGYFRGLTLQSNSVGDRESVEIEYKKNTRVFISLEKMDLIHRYIGSNNNPPISSLGSKKWTGEIAKAKKSIQLVAQELLELYANKNRKRTFRYIEENDIDDALAKSFPFIETPDQQKAISDILTDMNGDSPVDRLICGDVGFGKTEVALRAILKAVLSNKQTTFLCPTTILADQHFITCKERLEPLGVTIGLLSRFKTKKEQGEIIKSLRNGGIDVLIGTHRVLSQDVVIPNLGLLVVDEEHRFGVNHKEKIRTMKQQIDVLTLSATPIPRTLQQSLVGIRDMSLIQTPPRSRKPIETVIRYFDWEAIVLYVEREVSRGGQVYFLHNDIKSLPYFTKKLQNRFPDVSVENIHGQLGSKELESKILSFFKGGIDILVCTTIIESGLDVTNANCIIINDAQNFGLSQLYQIRGRVGRGFNQAHCLLLIPRTKLEKNAHRRLKTIEQYTSLGSGYDISMKDLEIRGAGSLFGYKQSGHISTIGFELYCELLKNEVDLVMGKDEQVRFPNIVFSENALINEYYITNSTQRLGFYNRLSRAETQKDVDKVQYELRDRFGMLPVETKNLVFIARVRSLFKNTSIKNISINKTSVELVLSDIAPYVSLDKLFQDIAAFSIPENIGHRFGKIKSGDLTLTFSTIGIANSMSLLLQCSQLFLVSKDC